MAKDYYHALGVSKAASKEDIKAAYKKLAKQYHPDINKEANAAEKFKEINEAYSVLSDDTKRANYDRFGSAEQAGFSGFEGFGGGSNFSNFSFDDAFDIFDSFFGGSPFGRGKRRKRGMDLKTEIELTFEEAAFGVEKKIRIERSVKCHDCKGTGAEGGETKPCHVCNGSGVAKQVFRTPFGMVSQTSTCRECKGEGQTAKKKCPECGGRGFVKKEKELAVKVPAGVDNGQTLRLEDEGEAGERGADNGDMYIELHVKPHRIFERQGNDIYLEYPITFSQAALGAEVKIPTLDGDVKMKIPPGTQASTVFRLRGKGIKYVDGHGYGDENIQILVKTPEKLSKRQRELLEEFSKDEPELKPEKKEKNFFQKFREAFE